MKDQSVTTSSPRIQRLIVGALAGIIFLGQCPAFADRLFDPLDNWTHVSEH